MSVFHNLRAAIPSLPLARSDDPGATGREVAQGSHGQREPVSWMQVAMLAAGMWLATRLIYIVFTYFSVILSAQSSSGNPNPRSFGPDVLLNSWNRWDVGWYADMAVNGMHDWHAARFFPFFPLLTHLLVSVIGSSHAVAATMIVSNAGTLLAFIAVGWLAAFEFGADVAGLTLRALAAFPFMFFTFAGYSDSWFLAWAALSLLLARRASWPGCAACAFMAGITRPTAVVLIAPLLWEYGRQLYVQGNWPVSRWTRRSVVEALAVAGAVPLGYAVYGLYLWNTFHNPLEWVKGQEAADHYSVMPWDWVYTALVKLSAMPSYNYTEARIIMDLGAVVLVAALLFWGIQHLPVTLTIYSLAVIGLLVTVLIPADSDPFNGECRYALMAFPVFMLLGQWMRTRPWLDLLVVGGGFMLQGVFTAFWLRGGWIV